MKDEAKADYIKAELRRIAAIAAISHFAVKPFRVSLLNVRKIMIAVSLTGQNLQNTTIKNDFKMAATQSYQAVRQRLRETQFIHAQALQKFAKRQYGIQIKASLVDIENVLTNRAIDISEGFTTLGERVSQRAIGVIRLGLLNGEDSRTIGNSVNQIVNSAVNSSVKTLVRTATTLVDTEIQLETASANPGLFNYYQYVAILDSRTSEICRGLNGKVFPLLGNNPKPPQHWNCRSSILLSMGPDGIDTNLDSYVSGLSAVEQIDLLGATGAQAFQSGHSLTKILRGQA